MWLGGCGGLVSRQRTWKWCFIALVEGVSLMTEVSFCQHSLFTLFGLAECHLRLCHRPINTALDVEVPPPQVCDIRTFLYMSDAGNLRCYGRMWGMWRVVLLEVHETYKRTYRRWTFVTKLMCSLIFFNDNIVVLYLYVLLHKHVFALQIGGSPFHANRHSGSTISTKLRVVRYSYYLWWKVLDWAVQIPQLARVYVCMHYSCSWE